MLLNLCVPRVLWLSCFRLKTGVERLRLLTSTFLIALSGSTGAVSAQAPAPLTVVVEGTARSVPATSLQKLPRDSVRMVFHGQATALYEGVSLAGVLREVGVQMDSLRGPALATRLVVEAADGYRVVLALADLDPTLGGRRVLLADRMNGRPLPPDEAPWRLVVTGDQRPLRSARQRTTIRVREESS